MSTTRSGANWLRQAELHRAAFHQEKTRLDRFRLYFLPIEFGSRSDLIERIAELQADLQPYQMVGLTPLIELPGYAYLETYFEHKYAHSKRSWGN